MAAIVGLAVAGKDTLCEAPPWTMGDRDLEMGVFDVLLTHDKLCNSRTPC